MRGRQIVTLRAISGALTLTLATGCATSVDSPDDNSRFESVPAVSNERQTILATPSRLGPCEEGAVFRPCSIIEVGIAYLDCQFKRRFPQRNPTVAECKASCDENDLSYYCEYEYPDLDIPLSSLPERDHQRLAVWQLWCGHTWPNGAQEPYKFWGTEAQAYTLINEGCSETSSHAYELDELPPDGTQPGTIIGGRNLGSYSPPTVNPSGGVWVEGQNGPITTPPYSGQYVSPPTTPVGGWGGWDENSHGWKILCNNCFPSNGNGCVPVTSYAYGSFSECQTMASLSCNGISGYCMTP